MSFWEEIAQARKYLESASENLLPEENRDKFIRREQKRTETAMSLWDEVAKAKARLRPAGTEYLFKVAEPISVHRPPDVEREILGTVTESEEKSFSSSVAVLPPDQECRAAEACVDWMEWVLGLERITEEERERVALFRTRYVKMISIRNRKPYLDSLGIPRIPPDCEKKYRHWEGGQSFLDTLLELGASDRVIDMCVTEEHSPEDRRRWREFKAERQ